MASARISTAPENRSKGKKAMNNYSKAAMVVAMALTIAASAAQGAITPEQRAQRRAAVVARVGGLLRRPGTPSGRIAIVNAQKVVPVDEFKATYAKNTVRVKGVDYWVESAEVGIETVAAEECWAIMNEHTPPCGWGR